MDKDDRYWESSTKSSSTPVGKTVATSPARKARDRLNWIASQARQVFGSYRRDDFADPEVFTRNLADVLERYDDKVIEAVTSNSTGIQRACKFPPSIAEFVEFIDEHIRRTSYASQWDAAAARQLQEREELEREHDEPLEYRRAAAARIMADYKSKRTPETKPQRDTWKPPTADELEFLYAKPEDT